jgi:transposase
MPWNESNHMDERIKFVARLLDGENMSRMCREFGISRKTGYKIFNRYKDFGLAGLQDQSRITTQLGLPRHDVLTDLTIRRTLR